VGGAERQMHALHRGLRRRGVDVRVLADAELVGHGVREHEGVPVLGVPLPLLTGSPLRPGNLRSWRRWRALLRAVRREIGPVDLVQATPMRQPALWAHALSRALGCPWIGRVACSGPFGDAAFLRGNWLTRRRTPALARSAAAVVALDAATAAEAVAMGVPPRRVVRIPNALTTVPADGDLAPPGPDVPIVFVGRVAEQKRVEDLVDAYARLVGSSTDLPPLEVVGGGERWEAVRARAAAAGGEVRVRGQQPGPEPFLRGARCFVNPSSSEGFPNAVLEACAFGVPPILSDLPVHREIAAAVGTEAFLFPVGDVDALAAALRRFLDLPDGRQAAMRGAAARYARGFTEDARDEAYLALYERVLAERRAA
jgi:glycosyltransferase involved in cell wall biosynthesis